MTVSVNSKSVSKYWHQEDKDYHHPHLMLILSVTLSFLFINNLNLDLVVFSPLSKTLRGKWTEIK